MHYEGGHARAACLVFERWESSSAAERVVVTTRVTAEYVPGEFFKRELPPLLTVLGRVATSLDVVVVDGYVWLTGKGAGVGAHLHEALGRAVAVVGVAKTAWSRPGEAEVDPARAVVQVLRGRAGKSALRDRRRIGSRCRGLVSEVHARGPSAADAARRKSMRLRGGRV